MFNFGTPTPKSSPVLHEPAVRNNTIITEDPWIPFFDGGEQYKGYLMKEVDGKWWARDMKPSLFRRSICTAANRKDLVASIDGNH